MWSWCTSTVWLIPTCLYIPRWRHQMETFCALLALCAGNSPGTSDAELWCFLWSAPEQTVELTIDTPHSLWRHCNDWQWLSFLYYLPKFAFLQVCSFDVFSVCLSGWKIMHIKSRKLWHTFTKFDTQMYLGLVQKRIDFYINRTKMLFKILSPQLSEWAFMFYIYFYVMTGPLV